MLRTLARKEFVQAVRDGRTRLLALVLCVLFGVAVATGWRDARQHQERVDAARAAEQAAWLDQGEKNPHSAAHFGQWEIRPLGALAWIDRGVLDYVGPAVWLEAHWQNPFQMRPAEDETALGRFGRLTGARVLQALVPLLILFLGFGAFAAERERGTLRLVAAQGVGGRALFFGKALGLAAILAVVLVPGGLVGALVPFVADVPGERLEIALRLGVLAVAHVVYFAAWLALTLAISARARSARAALVLVLGFWTLSTLLVPKIAADLAEHLYPTPSAHEFYDAIAESTREGLDGRGGPAERLAALERETLERYGVETLEELPVLFAGLSLQASEEHSNLVFDRHFGALRELYRSQDRVHTLAALLSPTLAIRAVSSAIAGTDLEHHLHFADAAEAHRRVFVERLNDDLAVHGAEEGFAYRADAELWSETPRLAYEPPSLGHALAQSRDSLLLLALWGIVAVVFGLRQSRRLRLV